MYAAQLDAYRTAQKSTLEGRELEAYVLAKAAQMLTTCRDDWDASAQAEQLTEALKYNQRLWTLFQAELTKADNPLPQKVREDLLSLSVFVDRRILDIMAFPSPEKLTILININLNIAAGLRGSGA